jgi:hypothetical protein
MLIRTTPQTRTDQHANREDNDGDYGTERRKHSPIQSSNRSSRLRTRDPASGGTRNATENPRRIGRQASLVVTQHAKRSRTVFLFENAFLF